MAGISPNVLVMGIESVPRLTWREVCARRLVRHGLAAAHDEPAAAVAAMAGTHAQVLSAAELAIGLRTAGATRADVRTALWDEHTLVKTFGPRGTVHLLPSRDLPLWVAALSAVPAAPSPFPDGARMTEEQAEAVIEAIGDGTGGRRADRRRAGRGRGRGHRVLGGRPRHARLPGDVAALASGRAPGRDARGVLCFGPNRGRKVTYTEPAPVAARFRARRGTGRPGPHRAGLPARVRPGDAAAVRALAGAPVRWAEDLFASLAGELQRVEVEGDPAWVAAGDIESRPGRPGGVRLLPYFDGYAYRVGNQPTELLYPGPAAERVLPGNFQVLLVDGVVAGLWHQRRSGRHLDITVEPLVRLTAARRAELGRAGGACRRDPPGAGRPGHRPVTTGGHA